MPPSPSPAAPAQPAPADTAERLTGSVKRITFRNDENGFTIFRLAPDATPEGFRQGSAVPVIGAIPTVAVGERVAVSGAWERSQRWGLQFRAEALHTVHPTAPEGVAIYLADSITGIGPKAAARIVEAFGAEHVFEILDTEPERVAAVPGINKRMVAAVLHPTRGWKSKTAERDTVSWLREHGFGPVQAQRVWGCYKASARRFLEENPYRLIRDIDGIAFTLADRFAGSLGVSGANPFRVNAGISYAIERAHQNDGHVGLPETDLAEIAADTLGNHHEGIHAAIDKAIAAQVAAGDLVRIATPDGDQLHPRRLFHQEYQIAAKLLSLQNAGNRVAGSPDAALRDAETALGIRLSPDQSAAASGIFRQPVTIVTGGPGVGKTTILATVTRVMTRHRLRLQLCAPTGRAAKRMHQSTGIPATTIHRMLGFGGGAGSGRGFKHHAGNPLDTDVVILDEASMVDVPLMHALASALPARARFVIVGDHDQLPSIGPGQVLRDLIDCGAIPVHRLTQIHRQATGSRIITNAHRIRTGQGIDASLPADAAKTDFYWIESEDPEVSANTIVKLVSEKIPARFGHAPADIQVITPMRRTTLGVDNLNARLHAVLNPPPDPAPADPIPVGYPEPFRIRDRVMQTRNNYDLQTFNGDIGTIVGYRPDDRLITVRFPGLAGDRDAEHRDVEYGHSDARHLTLAYAITTHKSQGSEYPAVVIPVTNLHWVMLKRTLLYTAATRARQLVVMIGQPQALRHAIRNADGFDRHTTLPFHVAALRHA